jgi:hypothetical protein
VQLSSNLNAGSNFSVRANNRVAGGIIGELRNGPPAGNTDNIQVTLSNTVLDGYIENCYSNGVIGGLIGGAAAGCEIAFGGETVARPYLLTGDTAPC